MNPSATATTWRGKARRKMFDILLLLGFVGVWLALQLWILPRFGIRT
jgi:hypothetical protein